MRKSYVFSTMEGKKNPYASKLKKPVTMRLSEEVVEYLATSEWVNIEMFPID